MLRRNFPIFAFFLVFIAALYFIYSVPHYEPVVDIPEEEEEELFDDSFAGRVKMPSIDEIYVLENTAGRDLNRIARFLEGRAAGLHYLSSGLIKKSKTHMAGDFFKSDDDVIIGLRLSLDSLGRFKNPQIMFSNTDDKAFLGKLVQHVEYYWRLPPSAQGSLEMWIPIHFRAI